MNCKPTYMDMDMPLRVLFITRKWPPAVGGMETYSTELSAALGTLVNLKIFSLPGRTNGLPPTLVRLVIFLFTKSIYILFRSGRYDIIHLGDLALFPLAWLHAKRHPHRGRYITVHGLDLIYGNRRGLMPAIYRQFLSWAKSHADLVHSYLANSHHTAQLATAAGFTPSIPIPLGVSRDLQLTAVSPPYRQPTDTPYILFIGRLIPRKGAAWFAEYVLPNLPSNFQFHVVGKVWDLTEAALLKRNPRVTILGYLDDAALREQRVKSLVVVMPNRSSPDGTDVEGFGIAAIEAAWDGIPLLASAIEGITDAVIDGETGYLLPEGEPSSWVQAIVNIHAWSAQQRKDYATRASSKAREYFTWHRVARETFAAYQAYLPGRSNQNTLVNNLTR